MVCQIEIKLDSQIERKIDNQIGRKKDRQIDRKIIKDDNFILPNLFFSSTEAPLVSKNSRMFKWPFPAANMKAVNPEYNNDKFKIEQLH